MNQDNFREWSDSDIVTGPFVFQRYGWGPTSEAVLWIGSDQVRIIRDTVEGFRVRFSEIQIRRNQQIVATFCLKHIGSLNDERYLVYDGEALIGEVRGIYLDKAVCFGLVRYETDVEWPFGAFSERVLNAIRSKLS